MRKFVIGDIHGAYLNLIEVLQKSNFNYSKDLLISLGDIVDGGTWDESYKCVEELLKIKNIICVRGNHDVWCKNWLNYDVISESWLLQGGKNTILSYRNKSNEDIERHKTFFNTQKDWYIDDDNRLFIHAGWDYTKENFIDGATKERNGGVGSMECHWNRSLLKHIYNNDDNCNFLYNFKDIYIGHTSTLNSLPFNKFNLWNLDTGVKNNGVLTIMDIENKEFWQSSKIRDLYYS